jgi:hypothetical protein
VMLGISDVKSFLCSSIFILQSDLRLIGVLGLKTDWNRSFSILAFVWSSWKVLLSFLKVATYPESYLECFKSEKSFFELGLVVSEFMSKISSR